MAIGVPEGISVEGRAFFVGRRVLPWFGHNVPVMFNLGTIPVEGIEEAAPCQTVYYTDTPVKGAACMSHTEIMWITER